MRELTAESDGMLRDQEYSDELIVEVGGDGGRGWTVEMENGWSIYVTNERCQEPPQAGDTIRLYGRGIGYPVRGIAVGGNVYRYQSEQGWRQAEQDRAAEARRNRQEAAERERPERDARINALPDALYSRIRRFQLKPDWCADHEPYELFVCEQAAEIAKLGDVARIGEFHGAESSVQKTMVPGLSDDHSGNTFGAACYLARLLIEQPDMLPAAHGALCPLVGCADYGCFAAYGDDPSGEPKRKGAVA